jgi:hypothetical protein
VQSSLTLLHLWQEWFFRDGCQHTQFRTKGYENKEINFWTDYLLLNLRFSSPFQRQTIPFTECLLHHSSPYTINTRGIFRESRFPSNLVHLQTRYIYDGINQKWPFKNSILMNITCNQKKGKQFVCKGLHNDDGRSDSCFTFSFVCTSMNVAMTWTCNSNEASGNIRKEGYKNKTWQTIFKILSQFRQDRSRIIILIIITIYNYEERTAVVRVENNARAICRIRKRSFNPSLSCSIRGTFNRWKCFGMHLIKTKYVCLHVQFNIKNIYKTFRFTRFTNNADERGITCATDSKSILHEGWLKLTTVKHNDRIVMKTCPRSTMRNDTGPIGKTNGPALTLWRLSFTPYTKTLVPAAQKIIRIP